MDNKEIKLEYDKLLKTGMFFEFFPGFTGVWEKDKEDFTDFYTGREVNYGV